MKMRIRAAARRVNSGRKRSRRQPPEEPPWQAAAVVEHDACSGDRAVGKHSIHIARRRPATMQARRNKKARGEPALFAESSAAKLLADGGGAVGLLLDD